MLCHTVLPANRDQPPVHWVGKNEPNQQTQGGKPPKSGRSRLRALTDHRWGDKAHYQAHADHHGDHGKEFGPLGLPDGRSQGAPHVVQAQVLKMNQPKANPTAYFTRWWIELLAGVVCKFSGLVAGIEEA